jgi:hypothetical protein
MNNLDFERQRRAKALNLQGLLAHWEAITDPTWVDTLLHWEDTERAQRSLQRRPSRPLQAPG